LVQQYRLVLAIRDHGIAQVFKAPGHSDIADQIFAAVLVDEASAGVDAKARDGGFDLVVGDIEKMHRSGVRHDAILANFAADRNHLCNARNRQELGTQHEIGNLPHVHRRCRIACDRDQHDLAHDRGDGAHLRGGSARELFSHQRQTFRDQLTIAEDVGAPVEFDIDDRQTDARHGADSRHARHPVHDALDRKGDELFHLLRREAFGFGHQGHDWSVEIRKDVDGNAGQDEGAVTDQNQRNRDNDQTMA
jgi:hypothetical protein